MQLNESVENWVERVRSIESKCWKRGRVLEEMEQVRGSGREGNGRVNSIRTYHKNGVLPSL